MQAATDTEQQVPFLNTQMRQTQSPLGHKLWTVFVPHLPPWDPSSMATKSKENHGLL